MVIQKNQQNPKVSATGLPQAGRFGIFFAMTQADSRHLSSHCLTEARQRYSYHNRTFSFQSIK